MQLFALRAQFVQPLLKGIDDPSVLEDTMH